MLIYLAEEKCLHNELHSPSVEFEPRTIHFLPVQFSVGTSCDNTVGKLKEVHKTPSQVRPPKQVPSVRYPSLFAVRIYYVLQREYLLPRHCLPILSLNWHVRF